MTAVISGSMAFDTIMVFPDQFKNHILPDKVHILNVAFLVPQLRREFGGCAGNIAYNLNLLGGDGVALATIGEDFDPYLRWMNDQGVSTAGLKSIPGAYTAQAYITTDKDDNQITAFHPGAMNEAHQTHVTADQGYSIGMVAPNGRDAMLQHADEFVAAGIPFIFDPGQGLPMFNGDELLAFVEKATWVAVNDYESQLLQDRTGLSLEQLAEKVDALVVTLGGQGSKVYASGQVIDIPVAQADTVSDPTGCGDAYRAGLLFGLMNGLDWAVTGRIASLMGSIKVASQGTQNHTFTRVSFAARYRQAFGEDLVFPKT